MLISISDELLGKKKKSLNLTLQISLDGLGLRVRIK